MTHDKYNAFCAALPSTSYVMQWGGAHVWKVGGKVFAIYITQSYRHVVSGLGKRRQKELGLAL